MNALIHFKACGISCSVKSALASLVISSCRTVATVSAKSGKATEQAAQTEPVASPSPKSTYSTEEIRVSSNSKIHRIAGKISYAIRRGEAPSVLCAGATTVNIAMKAIAVSREFLQAENLDISMRPAIRPRDEVEMDTPHRLNLQIVRIKGRLATPAAVDADMSVSSNTDGESLGYALLSRLSEGRSPCFTAMGAVAVANAVLAVAHANDALQRRLEEGFLIKKNEIRLAPVFVTVTSSRGNEGFSALRLWVLTDDGLEKEGLATDTKPTDNSKADGAKQ